MKKLLLSIALILCLAFPAIAEVTRDNNYDEIGLRHAPMSRLTSVMGTQATILISSSISTSDTMSLYQDLELLKFVGITEVTVFINSPGGEAFQGLAIADLIESAQKEGINFTAYANGIVASAAVPIYAVCNKRIATSGTIFMVHEAAMFKWAGTESASDIRSQNEMMIMLQDRYMSYLVRHSKLSLGEWVKKEGNTTWFTAKEAVDWGLVDEIR